MGGATWRLVGNEPLGRSAFQDRLQVSAREALGPTVPMLPCISQILRWCKDPELRAEQQPTTDAPRDYGNQEEDADAKRANQGAQ